MPARTLIIEGVVEKVAQHEGNRYGIALEGHWYNGFGSPPCRAGDTVSIAYEKVQKGDQEYRNVKECRILESAPQNQKNVLGPDTDEEDASSESRADTIARSVALKAAVEVACYIRVADEDPSAFLERVVACAKRFESYLRGDSQ